MWDQLWNWAVGSVWKNVEKHDGESLHHLEQTVRNLDFWDAAGESSEGSKEDVIGNWTSGYLCSTVA